MNDTWEKNVKADIVDILCKSMVAHWNPYSPPIVDKIYQSFLSHLGYHEYDMWWEA